MRILAVGAHYDDIEIGCGGTLIKHVEKGDEVIFAITSSNEFRTGDVNHRFKEQVLSAGIMGIEWENIFRFEYGGEIHDVVADLDYQEPDIIFTQYEFDTHQDHRRASIIGQAVGRKRNITTLFYDSGSAYDFYPNIFSLIDWNRKLELINCYRSQIEYGAVNVDIVKKKNSYWASLISELSDQYAEAFVVRKMKWCVEYC